MQEQVIPKQTRFVTIKKYCELSGLSYATVNHMLKTGQLAYITTEGGLRRIDTKSSNADQTIILEKLDKTEKMIKSLCNQFNVRL